MARLADLKGVKDQMKLLDAIGIGVGSKSQLRVLAAGGCHIEGFPFGISDGFFLQALNGIMRPFLYDYLKQSRLSSPGRLVRRCGTFKPDILILQLAHYESLLYLRKRYARLRTQQSRTSSSGSPKGKFPSSMKSYNGDISLAGNKLSRWSLWSWPVIWVLDHYLSISGFPHIKLSAAIEQAARYFGAVEKMGIQYVFVLEPFPHADLTTARSRQKISNVMRDLSRTNEFTFVEISKPLKLWAKANRAGQPWKEALFLDSAHLNIEAHAKVGELLASAITNRLSTDVRKLTETQFDEITPATLN